MAKMIPDERIGQYLKAAFQFLVESGGSARSRAVMDAVGERLDMSDYERHIFEKTGYVRWQSVIHFYSIGAVKGGWLIKRKGVWHLTPEGESALELNDKAFIDEIERMYREWDKGRDKSETVIESVEDAETDEVASVSLTLDQAEGRAREEIENYLWNMGPYEFQDVIAALLRAIGYYTPFVAPRGRDGGIDIRAYRDQLGMTGRVLVQVKHRQDKVSRGEITQLTGLLQRDSDRALFVSSGGFSADALNEIDRSRQHIEKIDLSEVVNLWIERYQDLSEEDKRLMPMKQVMFLAPSGS